MSTPISFDEHCEQHRIRPQEYGQAFSAYLFEITGGEWDGDAVRVESAGATSTPAAWSELQVETADDNEAEDRE